MKFRKFLMTGALSLAVIAAFGFRAQTKFPGLLSVYVSGTCVNIAAEPAQPYCDVTFTGPQCTWQGLLAYEYEDTPTPTCSKPLRRPF